MPSAGQNMRDSVRQPAMPCDSVNTKKPAAPSCADKRREPREIRLELLELFGAAHADHQARAGAADDAQRAARVDVAGRKGERVEHRETLAIVELAAERRRRLTNGDAARGAFTAHLDVDDAGLLPLAHAARHCRGCSARAVARQHEVRRDGGVADEARLGARREEAHAQLVIGAVGLEHERGVGVVELARDGEHLGVGERVGVEHHARGIAGEAFGGERVDLEDADAAAHGGANSTRKPTALKVQFPLRCASPRGGPARARA